MRELAEFGIEAKVHDPMADATETHHEYGLKLSKWEELDGLDAMVVAVPHKAYAEMSGEALSKPPQDTAEFSTTSRACGGPGDAASWAGDVLGASDREDRGAASRSPLADGLVTGRGGNFIGSHLVERLLSLGQQRRRPR